MGCDKEPSKLTSIRIRAVRGAKQLGGTGQRCVVLMALFRTDRDDRGSLRGSVCVVSGGQCTSQPSATAVSLSLSRCVCCVYVPGGGGWGGRGGAETAVFVDTFTSK